MLRHVDDRNLPAEAIPAGSTYFKPINTAERLCITKDASGVSIAGGTGETATVIMTNIRADKGVIHVIDKVLLPGKPHACHSLRVCRIDQGSVTTAGPFVLDQDA